MEKQALTAKDIIGALEQRYHDAKYRLANAYIFKENWESDLFVQNRQGYSYEFEVKITRSDFFADRKKVDKHLILSTGSYVKQSSMWNDQSTGQHDRWITSEQTTEHPLRPNRFYYVTPPDLVKKNEVPAYAGLIYCDGSSVYQIKNAPFIHKKLLNYEPALCNKFYHLFLKHRWTNWEFERDWKQVADKLRQLNLPDVNEIIGYYEDPEMKAYPNIAKSGTTLHQDLNMPTS